MDMKYEREKKRRTKAQFNKQKKFSWLEHQLIYNTRIWMDVKNKRQMKRRNEGQLHKRKKFPWLEQQENISEVGTKTEDEMWQYAIPDDILSYISDFLPLPDFIIFRSVCRSWRNAPSRRSSIVEFSLKDVWCILYDFDTRDRDMCMFYQAGERKSCSVKLPNLRGATCLASKHHWLLIRRNNNYLFFHPLRLEEIHLPPYPGPPFESTACQITTFIFVPTSTSCVVVLVSSRDPSTIEVAYCPMCHMGWLVHKVDVDASDVAMGRVLLPIPRHVRYLPPFGEPNNVIFIYYKTHWLSYDIWKKSFSTGKVFPEPGCLDHRDWYSKMREVHLDDLLNKFGDEVSLSFPLFNYFKGAEKWHDDWKRNEKWPDDWTRNDKWHVFGTEAQTTASAAVVKAAWL